MLEEMAEQAELSRRLRQYIFLRWIAAGAIPAGILASQGIFAIRFPAAPVLGLALALALLNAAFFFWSRREQPPGLPPGRRVGRQKAFAYAQIVTDLVALTVLLHFTGGVENPFFILYLVHAGVATLLLDGRDAIWVAVLAVTLFAGLAAGEFSGRLPHVHLEGFSSGALHGDGAYVAAVLIAVSGTLLLLSVVAAGIAGEGRRCRREQAAVRARELAEARERLEELARMRTYFLDLASHDLKTPLAVGINYVQTILDGFVGDISPKQRRWLERTLARLEELLQLINDFLDVSLLDAQRIVQEMEPTSLPQIAWQAIDDVAVRAKEKGVAVENHVPADLPAVIGSPKRLRRLLVNLLDNGIKFTPPGGTVSLAAEAEAEHIRVDVADTGVGIPSGHQPHLFEDYFRARLRQFVPGAGLGLATARNIVKAHGGRIQVESPYCPEHCGSKFSCYLPKEAALPFPQDSERQPRAERA